MVTSAKEISRRKIARLVMRKAHFLFRRSIHTWSKCLIISWKAVRSRVTIHHTKIRGTSFGNRQLLLKRLSLYPETDVLIRLKRDTTNSFDRNAIMVIAEVRNKGSAHIGYVSKELAALIVPYLDSGYTAVAWLDSITGLCCSKYSLGMNFCYIII